MAYANNLFFSSVSHSLSLFFNFTLRVRVWIIFIKSNQKFIELYFLVTVVTFDNNQLHVACSWVCQHSLTISISEKTFCWAASVLGRCHHIVIILIESDKKQKLNNHGLEVSIFCLENYIFSLVSCSVLLGKTRVGLVSHALLYSFFTFYLENIKLIQKKFFWWIDVFQLGSFSTY